MQNDHFNFIQEKIKQKPYSRKKLLRRMAITVAMAVLFGCVASFTFFILEPVFNNWIHPEEEARTITLPKDEDEITLEDIVITEKELQAKEESEVGGDTENKGNPEVLMGVAGYERLYEELEEIATEAKRSLVTIESVTSEMDWFAAQQKKTGQSSGFIVADNGVELIVIVHESALANSQSLQVTFCDGTKASATIKQEDERTGLLALAVLLEEVPENTLESIAIATLGSSLSSYIMAQPVIALGRPLDYQESIMYGMVTSTQNGITIPDGRYYCFTTNMVGTRLASGVIVDMQGRILGLIAQEYAKDTGKSSITAIGITELKPILEKIMNGEDTPYLGIHPVDIPVAIGESMEVPQGVYVSAIAIGSPAMTQGIQSGDIIMAIDGVAIKNTSSYVTNLLGLKIGKRVVITLARQSGSEYKEITVEVVLGD